jgi:hypothetical protein
MPIRAVLVAGGVTIALVFAHATVGRTQAQLAPLPAEVPAPADNPTDA